MKNTYKIHIIILFLLIGLFIQAQNNPVASDSIPPLPYKFDSTQNGSLFLNSSETEVIYDSETGKYLFLEKIGDYYIKRPIYMTAKEYEQYRKKRDIIEYYKSKTSAIDGKKEGSDDAKKDLLPKYYINSQFFESLFGSNEIEVNAQGNVLVKFGVLYQKTEDPRRTEKQRKSTTPDFDQQISASINAKVGTRLGVNINYDTQSTFDFQNLIKLEYTPTEDDIIQKIEIGNVSMPLQSSLIKGAQNLFGAKVKLQFGGTEITMVGAKQQSQTRSVAAQGGSTVQEFELKASEYDKDKHYFLAQRFRNNYNKALENFPLINSSINITRVEVWVTNRNNQTENVRNIVAIADLAERDSNFVTNPSVSGFTGQDPSNEANSLSNLLTIDGNIREFTTLSSAFTSFGLTGFSQGSDYSVLEHARKLTLGTDFTLQPQLGYISLNRALSESEVLAVAFEYTENGQVYTVGELSDNGVIAPANLVVKLLRPEIISTNTHMWDLMMKNVYDLRSFQMNPDGFRFEILYQDNTTGVPLNMLQNATTVGINNKPLLNLLRVDRLDSSNNAEDGGDGFFDYVEGITVNSQKGLVFFPIVEPFGNYLDQELDSTDDNYVFNELYERTQSDAQNNFQSKDKYLIKGYYKSKGQNGIPLGAFNVPRGSVVVTTGGRNLVEGVDYVVDYQIGNVQIINQALISSNAPIQVSVETNNAFSTQKRSFYGIDIQHKFSDKFAIGATYLKLGEKPFTHKAQFGAEPVNNSIAGFNLTYTTEVPKITNWVNYLPNIDTDAPSNFSIRAEAAYLMPNSPKRIELNGEAASYLDDFESTQIPLNIDTPTQWKMASMPTQKDGINDTGNYIYADDNETSNFKFGNRRARFNWYTIDRLFYGSSLRPDSVDDDELSRDETRRVAYSELFPDRDIDISQSNIVQTLNLAYFPQERASYNFETDNVDVTSGKFTNPDENWGGIMRALTTTDFQQANVEYIQFWMMDPFENYSITTDEGRPNIVLADDYEGEMYINIGNISEDILHDERKMFEHGLPKDGNQIPGQNVDETEYSVIPTVQALINAFSEEDNERPNQDLGLDGRNDISERDKLTSLFGSLPTQLNTNDPANDNYEYFRSTHLDIINASILTRYKNYNRTQGNSPTLNNSTEDYPTTGSQYPDTEDLNRDQTMSTAEAYYQYKIKLKKDDFHVGSNYIIAEELRPNQIMENGETKNIKWYQYRIPIQTINNDDPDNAGIAVGGISSFNSIRFMRVFLTKFKIPVVIRLAKLELVRGNWRRYTKVLNEPLPTDPSLEDLTVTQNQNFEVGVVSIFQNRSTYRMPPGVEQERLQGNTSIQRQNEQSITMKVTDLKPGATRAVYKNTTFDMRMFKKLKLFVHLERNDIDDTDINPILNDEDLSVIIRIGSDIKDNYYQIEVPLLVSTTGTLDREDMWKNNIEAALEEFGKLRLERYRDNSAATPNVVYPTLANGGVDGKDFGKFKLYVKGNPSLSKIKTMMLGVKNNSLDKRSAELWFNELRVVDFDNKGGWAAVANTNLNLADFADVAASGGMSSQGFGSLDQRVGERSQQDVMQYDIVSNVNLGQLLPKNYGIKLPFNYSISEEIKNPKYDGQYQDVLFENTDIESSPNRDNATDYTKRRSVSLINVRKERTNQKKKPHIYDVENLSVSFAYNDTQHHDYNIAKSNDKNVRATGSYNYSFKPKAVEPFKNSKFFKKKKYLKLIKDFNFNYLPSSFSVNSNINRTYNEFLSRPLVESSILPDLPVLERRNYAFDWDYNVAYDLTKSLKFNFRAANSYINDAFEKDSQNRVIDGEIFNKFFTIGRPDHYHQKLDATYKLPLNKIPYLKFITGTYSYTADFDWQASSINNASLVGNTIQNANTHNFNSDLDMKKLYKALGVNNIFMKKNKKKLKKKKNIKTKKEAKESDKESKDRRKGNDNEEGSKLSSKKSKKGSKSNGINNIPGTGKSGNRLSSKRSKGGGRVNRKNLSFGKKAVLTFVDLITSVKKIRLSYTENNGTLLPGYIHDVGFLGRDTYSGGIAPTFGFVFGQQNDILSTALDNNWIVTRGGTNLDLYPYYNKTYSKTHFDKLDYNLTVKPFKNFNIDVNGTRTYTRNMSQQIDIINDGILNPYMQDSPISELGNYSISHFMLGTAFTDSKELFNSFLANRDIISQRLAQDTGNDVSGYGQNSQDVLLPAFIATYSGENLNKTKLNPFKDIPLPNWRVSYKGLSKIKWVKKRFRTVTLEHNYQSAYSILGYSSNLQYEEDINHTPLTDITGVNYRSETLYSGVNLVEAFSPLIKLDVKMKNSFSFRGEIKTDRSLNLNFANSSITEIKGKEYVFGLGYKLKNVKWVMRLGNTKKNFKGDINFKADFGIRNNETHIRSFETLSDQITGGQTIMTIKFTADYNLNKNLMASFFYDQNSSKFAVSTSFPRKSISSGISIRYNIGN